MIPPWRDWERTVSSSSTNLTVQSFTAVAKGWGFEWEAFGVDRIKVINFNVCFLITWTESEVISYPDFTLLFMSCNSCVNAEQPKRWKSTDKKQLKPSCTSGRFFSFTEPLIDSIISSVIFSNRVEEVSPFNRSCRRYDLRRGWRSCNGPQLPAMMLNMSGIVSVSNIFWNKSSNIPSVNNVGHLFYPMQQGVAFHAFTEGIPSPYEAELLGLMPCAIEPITLLTVEDCPPVIAWFTNGSFSSVLNFMNVNNTCIESLRHKCCSRRCSLFETISVFSKISALQADLKYWSHRWWQGRSCIVVHVGRIPLVLLNWFVWLLLVIITCRTNLQKGESKVQTWGILCGCKKEPIIWNTFWSEAAVTYE